jgi:hypothetical protein
MLSYRHTQVPFYYLLDIANACMHNAGVFLVNLMCLCLYTQLSNRNLIRNFRVLFAQEQLETYLEDYRDFVWVRIIRLSLWRVRFVGWISADTPQC